jgi:hypothetical protein
VSMQNSRPRFDNDACHERECPRNIRVRGSTLRCSGNCFAQALQVHLEDGVLGIFKHV